MTQNEAILDHFQNGGTLTHIEAFTDFRCARLAARVKDLRSQGHDIRTVMIHQKSNGKTVSYARYFMPLKAEAQTEVVG